nr:NAD(P)-dependent oxidoreductase [uncultured Holophaga sp.]
MKNIGIFGLGIIGSAWAQRYAAAGCLAGTWNRSPRPEAPGWRASALELARASEVLQIVVADPAAVEAVLEQVLPALGPGKTLIQSSTIDPDSSERFAARVRATGAVHVEAPFTGSKPAALSGKTVFFLGGETADLDAVEPVLACLSEVRLRAGTVRQAATIKLAMNLNLAIQMQGFCESLDFARRAGISDDLFFQVLGRNMGHSPLIDLKEPKLREGDFSPQFSVKHMAKDTRLAAGAATVAYPLLESAKSQLEKAQAEGWGEEDYISAIRLLGR